MPSLRHVMDFHCSVCAVSDKRQVQDPVVLLGLHAVGTYCTGELQSSDKKKNLSKQYQKYEQ